MIRTVKSRYGRQPRTVSVSESSTRDSEPHLLLPAFHQVHKRRHDTKDHGRYCFPVTQLDTDNAYQISDSKYKGSHYRPAHKYHFQPAILRCNHQVNQEATAVFHNTNLFVSVSHNYSSGEISAFGEKFDLLESQCDGRGFPVLARGKKARLFDGYAMEIYLGRANRRDARGRWWNSPKPQKWEIRPKFMIASDDLLQFCKIFLLLSMRAAKTHAESDSMLHLKKAMLLVDVLHKTDQHNRANEGPRPAIRRLLEPLAYFHNIGLVIIEGPVPTLYSEAIRQRIQRRAPSAQDLVHAVSSLVEQGDAAFLKRDFHSAVFVYKSALEKLHAGSQKRPKLERMVEGTYTGMVIGGVKNLLQHKVYLGLSKASLQLKRFEMAHHWTLAVARGLRDTREILSQMWFCRALASKGLGELEQALKEMEMARLIQPNDLGILAEIAILSSLLGPGKQQAEAV